MTASLKGSRARVRVLGSVLALCLALLVSHATILSAQEYLATLSGTVTDPTGAAVTNANVKVTNTDTNVVTNGTTNGDGAYSVPFLVPGNYTVEVSISGFKPATKTGVVLHASDKGRGFPTGSRVDHARCNRSSHRAIADARYGQHQPDA
jgi:hypothetical protein